MVPPQSVIFLRLMSLELDAIVRNPGIECESISWLTIQYRGDPVPLVRMKALNPAVALDPDAQLCEFGFYISDQ
jgi:hypothetical protein